MVTTRASSRRASSPPPSPAASTTASNAPSGFKHAPSPYTLAWLAFSLPVVLWDTGYVLGRPHTMEGGVAHWPLWLPYKLYAEVDYVYGWKAVHDNNGFTAAQGLLNVVETAMYVAYLWVWHSRGEIAEGEERAYRARVVRGRPGALALLVGFSAAVMTLSKTVLYCE